MVAQPSYPGKDHSLKSYVRYDNSGRIIAGSLIRRRSMPKTGRWIEISSNLCCTTTTLNVT